MDPTFVLPARAQMQALILQHEVRHEVQMSASPVWDIRLEDSCEETIVVMPRVPAESTACPAFQSSGLADASDGAGRHVRVGSNRVGRSSGAPAERHNPVDDCCTVDLAGTCCVSTSAHLPVPAGEHFSIRRAHFALPAQVKTFCPGDRLQPHSPKPRSPPSAGGTEVPPRSCLIRCKQVHQVSRLPAALQQVPLPGASTAFSPQPPACPFAPSSAPAESKVGSLSSLAPWEVPILPEDLNQPPARDQCVSRFPWFVGFRATGGVTCTSQQYRYALFSVERQAEVRELGPGWCLNDVVQDVLRVIQNLRNIRVLLCRLAGFPALQVVATSSTVPLPGHAYPLDLRSAGGRVCTVVLFPGMTHGEVDDRIHRECQDFRRPDRPFSLHLPDGRPFRAIPFQVLGPDFIKGEVAEAEEVTVDIDEADLLQLSLHQTYASDGCKGSAFRGDPASSVILPTRHGDDTAAASIPLFSAADILDFTCMQLARKPTDSLHARMLPGLTGISCPAGPAT